jgi:hypothetical protein
MDGDNRAFHSLGALVSRFDGRATAWGWLRLGDWRKRKRKRKRYSYDYNVLIFHLFIFLSFFFGLP